MMGRTRKTRNRSLSPAPSVSVVRTPISSTPHERRDLPEVKAQEGRNVACVPEGRAADYFEDLDSEIQNDFDTAVQKLKQRFCPKELERMYYSELFQRKQISGESVEDYGNGILKLARWEHGGVSLDGYDRLAMEHFLQGFHPMLNQTSKPVIKLFKHTNIGTFEEIDEFSDEESLPEDPYTTYSTILHSDVSDNEILIDEEEHLVNLDKTFCDISNDFQLVEDNANKSEDKEDNTGDDIISISDTLTFGDMNSSSHVIIEETIITIIID
ncbi:unnamed protein product [Mytilus coruscus]|uniref:Uncharacterized protein n=1 Tax=Mytilus coruscus TaxID=42192 RepID=A0A6J8BM62_MYTCO|nr:unnamed protein product [Mytilus coruscus]